MYSNSEAISASRARLAGCSTWPRSRSGGSLEPGRTLRTASTSSRRPRPTVSARASWHNEHRRIRHTLLLHTRPQRRSPTSLHFANRISGVSNDHSDKQHGARSLAFAPKASSSFQVGNSIQTCLEAHSMHATHLGAPET